MHDTGKSDRGTVPTKGANKTCKKAAEFLEGEPMTNGNHDQAAPAVAQYTGKGSFGLDMIRKAARRDKTTRFTSLMHHLTIDLLRDAFYALRHDAATGVDDMTWAEYKKGVDKNIPLLHKKVQEGAYRAKPSKRIYLLKPDGRQRPIGIAALEDKIVQQACVWILNQIYEEDFLGFSYGFRPQRNQHKALDAIYVGINRKVSWVLDADIKGFFDNLDHKWLMEFLKHRIADPRMLRMIQKWLKAGVSEEGEWSETVVGTPQGAVISPLLANIYLHYVLDLWVVNWRKKAKGEQIIVRYADDFVAGFQYKSEAEGFLEALKTRMKKFGLELHETKTKLIEFGRFAIQNRKERGAEKPETFNFLGFTHICSTTKKGLFLLRRITIAKKMRAKVVEIREKLMKRMHHPVDETGKWLKSVVQGHFNYYAVHGNFKALNSFRHWCSYSWLASLRRRSQRGNRLTWEKFSKHLEKWMPTPKLVHPYPNERLHVKYQR